MPKELHLVDEGFVYCPRRRKDVDVEQCFACSRLDRMDLDARHPYVVCDVGLLRALAPSPADLAP
jgi:hypothetical protein